MAKQSNKNAKTKEEAAAPTEFHYFTKLPMEIQSMIWNIHRDRAAMQHCFHVAANRYRFYAAIDAENREIVNRCMEGGEKGQNSLPYESKIRFTGTVRLFKYKPGRNNSSTQNSKRAKRLTEVPSAHVYADLERDLFYFNYSNHSRGDWLRFIHNPIDRIGPPQLPESHWIFRVRNIALRLPTQGVPVSVEDSTLLSGMKSLENVYLVVPRINPRVVGYFQPPKKPKKPKRAFKFVEKFPPRERLILEEKGEKTEEDLRAIFTQNGSNPCIRVVVENEDPEVFRRTDPKPQRRYYDCY
ncbi:hypothetical protein Hte_007944 [Hypoxylon texense]